MDADVEIKQAILKRADGSLIQGEFHIWDFDPDDPSKIRLAVVFDGRQVIESKDDYFSALRSIRRVLEQNALLIDCYGASLNVYPSPMSRDMGAGEKAYRLKLAQDAQPASLVSIFETGSDVIPSTVDQQEAFFNQWKKSVS